MRAIRRGETQENEWREGGEGLRQLPCEALGPILSHLAPLGEIKPCGHVRAHGRTCLCVGAHVGTSARTCVSVCTRLAGPVPLTPHLKL